MIRKKGDEWCVYSKDGKELGCHPTESEAKAQLAAIEANKMHAQGLALAGVEIFATGKHNGDDYSEQDLEDMVAAFGVLDYQPPVKLGHDDSPGAPAVGYITALRREGGKLLADISDIPEKVYQAIKDKLFNRVSAEIYWNLERGGKKFRRALKALALLGAQIPAVAGLRPLAELFTGNVGEVHTGAEISTGGGEAGPNSEGGTKMDEKDIKALQERLAKAESEKAEEAKKREAAEKALAEKTAAAGLSEDLAASISRLTNDEKAARIGQLAQQVKAAEDAAKKEKEAREAVEKRMGEESERIKKLEESSRAERIEKLAETCRVPALRQFIRQFADLATRGEEVKVYDAKGDPKAAIGEVTALIAYVNANAQRLFSVISSEDPARKSAPEPSAEVDRRAKQLMTTTGEKSYQKAVAKVLAEDPQLKADYAAA